VPPVLLVVPFPPFVYCSLRMTQSRKHPDLRAIARQAMLDRGFIVTFSHAAQDELKAVAEPAFAAAGNRGVRDLSSWLWSSIDNDDSRDLDQVEYATEEAAGIRVYIGIADVDWFVAANSALDDAAGHNTTSVYTGVQTFPMLPDKLSTNLSSLNEGQKRLAVVSEMLVADDGRVAESAVYPAIVQNKAQLAYNAVAAWLDEEEGVKTPEKIVGNAELQTQLKIQDAAAGLLRGRRHQAGALTFQTAELQPVLSAEGVVIDLQAREHNRASRLIEDFMIAANQATAGFLEQRGSPSIRRVVKTPARWDRIRDLAASLGGNLPKEADARRLEQFLQQQQKTRPARFPDLSLSVIKLLGRGEYMVKRAGEDAPGHFGLAVQNYSHSTAPNRRYADLLTQRLVKAALSQKNSPYSAEALKALATHCTEKEDDANKVERLVKKCAAATMLRSRIGEYFEGVVSGINASGTWVRVSLPPVEGRMDGAVGHLDVGHRVRVRLDSVNPEKGFIDFELVK
jgi:VacB/RNase II family 3'-5' exoribonuclease